MPRRIVLHAGFHKTGTSTVQQVLRANRPLLQPELAMRLKGQMKELMHATRGFSTWRDPLTLAKATRRFGAVLDSLVAMPRRVLVVSAEELSGHMPGREGLVDYSAAPILLQRFSDEITARFPGAEQVIYFSTRDPNAWMRSAYWEHVKSSSMTLDYDGFLAANENAADFDRIIQAVKNSVKAQVHSTPLEACNALPLGPADPLFDLCDLSPKLRAQITPQPATNQRLDDGVLLALLQANRAYADRDERKAAKQLILAEANKNV
jgi:hypothetical protein